MTTCVHGCGLVDEEEFVGVKQEAAEVREAVLLRVGLVYFEFARN